jgi:hypothetical protein
MADDNWAYPDEMISSESNRIIVILLFILAPLTFKFGNSKAGTDFEYYSFIFFYWKLKGPNGL